jgi:hypothetical protein
MPYDVEKGGMCPNKIVHADETCNGINFCLIFVKIRCAGVTQLVECQLPKLNVASSNLVTRSKKEGKQCAFPLFFLCNLARPFCIFYNYGREDPRR